MTKCYSNVSCMAIIFNMKLLLEQPDGVQMFISCRVNIIYYFSNTEAFMILITRLKKDRIITVENGQYHSGNSSINAVRCWFFQL